MNTRILKGVTAGLLSAAMLSACGGGSGSSTPPTQNGGSTSSQKTNVTLKFSVPSKTTTAVKRASSAKRRNFGNVISPSAKALGVSIVAHGAALPALRTPQFAVNIAAGTNANNVTCTAANPDGSYDCTLLVAAPVGYDDVQVTAWDANADAQGFAGTFNAGQNLVAFGLQKNVLIQLNQQNSFNVPMGGVVYSAVALVSPNSLVAGAPSGSGTTNPTDPTVTVVAKDIDGNVITGSNPYYDATGTPTTLRVTETESPLSGFSQQGRTYFPSTDCTPNSATCATADFANPSVTTTVHYDGAPISSSSFALSAAAGTPAGSLVNAALSFTKTSSGGIGVPGTPTVTQFDDLGQGTFAPGRPTATGIATGPDGNIWYAEPYQTVPGPQLVRMTAAGVKTGFPTTTAPTNVAAGADGYIWYTTTGTSIGKLDPSSGIVTEYSGLSGVAGRIITGPDGAIYGTEYQAGKVFRMSALGNLTEWTVTSNGPTDLAVSKDGNIYVTVNGPDHVAQLPFPLPAGGTSLTENAVSGATGNTYNSIAAGSDGNLWLLESGVGLGGNSLLVSFAPSATPVKINEYTVSTSNKYQYVVAGPDSNFYMTQGGLGSSIARVGMTGSTLEFTNGVDPAAYSNWLAVGPSAIAPYTANSAVWFSEGGTASKVGAIQP